MHGRGTRRATILVADAVMATVKKAGPAGAPLDRIYADLQENIGCNYSQFNALMRALEATGSIRRTAELAFYVPWPRMVGSRSTPRK